MRYVLFKRAERLVCSAFIADSVLAIMRFCAVDRPAFIIPLLAL